MITLTQLTTDPRLLGLVFNKPSYRPMLAVLKAALAEPLSSEEREIFARLCGDRPLPLSPVAEAVINAGRGAGKTQGGGLGVIYFSTCRRWPTSPGQVPVALLLAADREQASVAYRYTLGLLESSPVLANEIAAVTQQRITLRSGVEIQVATSDYRAVRGRSLICVVADELAFWPTTPTSASPDSEVLIAVRPGLARFRGSMLVAISSSYAQQGELYEYFRRYHGTDDPRVLVAHGGTRDFNPTFPQAVIDDALARDPVAAAAEYLSQFRADLASFIDAGLVDGATRSEPRELPRVGRTKTGTPIAYVAAVDASGGRGDATAAAVAHRDGTRVVVDAGRRWPAPHDPQQVAREVAALLETYGLTAAVADEYGAELARVMYREAGVALVSAPDNRSDTYLKLLPLLTTGRAELPPDPILRQELLGLQRRTRSGGRDAIDHRPGGHDDLANAVALAAVAAARRPASDGIVAASHSDLSRQLATELGPIRYLYPT